MAKKKQAKKGKGGKPKKEAKKPAAAKNGKRTAKPKAAQTKAKKAPPAELAALKVAAKGAQAGLDKAKSEAEALRKKAAEVESKAKGAYRVAVAPYRDACRKAGVECEFAGARAVNVSERVRFLVEKADGGVRVTVEGRPETKEVIPTKVLKDSVTKAAYAYTDKHIGPKERVGNKGGSLSNRLRAVLAKS